MSEQQNGLSNLIITITTLIFTITSMITVYISISAWQEERESVRPYLTFYRSPEVYLANESQLVFSFEFDNVGQHPASSLRSQTIIVDKSLTAAPLHIDQFSLVNFIPQNTPAPLIIKLLDKTTNKEQFVQEYYIIISLKYLDPVLDTAHEQVLYLSWPGIKENKISPIFHASKQDKDRIDEYLEDY